jgi:hypothetical protein
LIIYTFRVKRETRRVRGRDEKDRRETNEVPRKKNRR